MPQNWITGVSLRKERLEWTVLRRGKEGWTVARRGGAALEGQPLDGAFLKTLGHPFMGAVVLGMPLEDVLLRVATMPSEDPDELLGMAELQVEKFAPYPLDTMAYGAEALAPEPDGETRLAMVASREEAVEAYGAAFQSARVLPDRVDLSLLGWWQGLQARGIVPETGLWLAVRLLSDGGEALLVRDAKPARAFAIEAPPLAETAPAAADAPAETGDAAEAAPAAVTPSDVTALTAPEAASLPSWVEAWTEELAYELTAAEAEGAGAEEEGPAKVLLATEAATRPAAEALAEAWRGVDGIAAVEVAALDDFPPASEGLARRFADPAVPLSLDLAPAAWREADKERQFRRSLLQVGVAFLMVWAVALVAFLTWLNIRRSTLARAEAEAQALERPALAVRALKATLKELQVYADRSASPLECLRAVSLAMPDGISMSSFVYVKGQDLKIRGDAEEAQRVYDFVSELEKCGLFPVVHNDAMNTRAGQRQTAFSLTAYLPGSTNAAEAVSAPAAAPGTGGAS
ncbi:MAG: hypothetical protein IJT88_01710 [Kiritimatiellae bacterium]|nr:hypothetical protein [Kiritimatiellia bacterium]